MEPDDSVTCWFTLPYTISERDSERQPEIRATSRTREMTNPWPEATGRTEEHTLNCSYASEPPDRKVMRTRTPARAHIE